MGIIAAQQDNGVGIDGINDKAPIWAGRAIGSGKWAESLVEFVDAAKDAGKPNAVVNLSLDLTQTNPDGTTTTRYEFTPSEREAIEYARQQGVLIVAAAGNDSDVMSVLGQASQEFDNIITVGAAEQVDSTVSAHKGVTRAEYSSYGEGLDLMAMGGTEEYGVLSTTGDGVGTMAGTSVATAKVTGAVSQIWAANPDLSYRQVREILKSTATDLNEAGEDVETGAGLLNIAAAVQLAKATSAEEYDPEQILISDKWGIDNGVTAGERAVQTYRIKNPSRRRIYRGYLNKDNPSDKLEFTLKRSSYLQFAFHEGARAKLYTSSGRRLTSAGYHPNPDTIYASRHLGPGKYYIQVERGSRSRIEPYRLIMNFDDQTPKDGDPEYWLPRPVLRKEPSFNKRTPKPSKDRRQIERELAAAKARRERERAAQRAAEQRAREAARKAAEEAKRRREAAARLAAERAAAAARAEQKRLEEEERRRKELEKQEAKAHASKAIELVEEKNADWLGEVLPNGDGKKKVEFDWDTQMDNRVAAIKYFKNGYIIWNGIHAVAYKEGSGVAKGEELEPEPEQVRLHDWGPHYGRVEYGGYAGESKRDDYYKFTVDKVNDSLHNRHKLEFALRSPNGKDISGKDATIEILNEGMRPIRLQQQWEPEKKTGKPGLVNTLRDGETYYVLVKPGAEDIDYKVVMNLDSAGQDSSFPARNLGQLQGRKQFRDYLGYKGDGDGDYYRFDVADKSFLRFSLDDLESDSQIKAEILDKDKQVVPLNDFNRTYGDVTLERGEYYLRLLPEGDTSTNYLLTTQMAVELGEYLGRHEFENRVVRKDEESYYRFTVGEAGAKDFHLKLKGKKADVDFDLRRDTGGGIVNSELVVPHVFDDGGDLYKRYDYLPPGSYLVRVNLEDDSRSYGKYGLVMNMDLAGNSLETARDLGDLSGKRVELKDFVGWNKGDDVDFYKFTTDNREFRLQFALREMTGAPHIDVLDEGGNVIPLKEFDDGGSDRYGNVQIPANGTFYLRVKAPDNRDDSTNYKLVVNATDDVAILIDGHTVAGDIYKVYKDDEIRKILGKPTWGVQHYEGSDYQIFEGGSIVSSSHGTFPLHGSIREYYVKTTGGLEGPLGPPTSGEYHSSTGVRQDFANGYIVWTDGGYEGFDKNGVPLFGGGEWQNPLGEHWYVVVPGGDYRDPLRPKHNGLDFATGRNTPSVKAAKGGKVVIARSGWNGGYGNYVKIDHGNGLETRYAHLSKISVKEGQYVSAGTVIGNVGTTGNSTGNHLHFEVRKNGVPQNPRDYIFSNGKQSSSSGSSNSPPKVELPQTGGDNSNLPDINSLSLSTNDPNLAAVYRIGSPARPEIKHDKGFSEEGKEEPTLKDYWIRQKWREAAIVTSTPNPLRYLPDGAAAYFHYQDGKGADRYFSYDKFVKDDENGKIALNNLILDAQTGAENLYHQIISKYPAYADREVKFNITSRAIVVGEEEDSPFPYPQTENWQKAIGGHSVWLSASAIVTPGQPANYELDFTLHAEDRYNFDKGKEDIASGTPDAENGRLVVVGLAHEYMNYSTLSRYVTWKQGNLNNATTTDGPVRRLK